MSQFTKEVTSVEEYRHAVKHAEALDFEVSEVRSWGNWETKDGEPVFIEGARLDVEKVGTKYVTADIDGRRTKLVFGSASRTKDAGFIRLTFSEVESR